MTIHYTDEMIALSEIFRPWYNACKLREDAPQEAKEAKKKFDKLLKEQEEFELSLM